MILPTLQSGGGGGWGLWSGEVRVSPVSVDADWKRVNQTVSTVPDYMDVEVSQRDSRTQLRGCGQCGLWQRVGLCVPEWY